MRGWLVLALLGCGPQPTSAGIEVRIANGEPAPSQLTLDVFSDARALVQDRILPPAALPSRVILELPAVDQTLRVAMVGTAATARLVGSVVVEARAHQQVDAVVVLSTKTPDLDGDGIADDIDNCPAVANPDQRQVACMSDVTVRCYDLDNGGAEVTGLFVVITDDNQQKMGFSPLTETLPPGMMTIDAQEYPPYKFDHWADGSATRPLLLPSPGASGEVRAYYHEQHDTVALEVHAFDIDHANAEIPDLETTVIDADGNALTKQYTPASYLVPVGMTTLSLASFKPYTFDHWEDGTTASTVIVPLSANADLKGYYHYTP